MMHHIACSVSVADLFHFLYSTQSSSSFPNLQIPQYNNEDVFFETDFYFILFVLTFIPKFCIFVYFEILYHLLHFYFPSHLISH